MRAYDFLVDFAGLLAMGPGMVGSLGFGNYEFQVLSITMHARITMLIRIMLG